MRFVCERARGRGGFLLDFFNFVLIFLCVLFVEFLVLVQRLE